MEQHRFLFELERIEKPAYDCVVLTGRLAYHTQLAAEQKLAAAAAAVEHPLIIVDTSGLQFLDSTGLALLVRFFKRVVSAGHAMAIVVGENAMIEKILLIAKLDRLLPIAADEQQVLALAPLSSSGPIEQAVLLEAWQQRRAEDLDSSGWSQSYALFNRFQEG
ncbi:STAS domain-containing protein [Caldibacillus thermoamylovorans]